MNSLLFEVAATCADSAQCWRLNMANGACCLQLEQSETFFL
jgi:hypothetical protein